MNVLFATDRSDTSSFAYQYLLKLPFAAPVDFRVISVLPITMPSGFAGYPLDVQKMVDNESQAIKAYMDSMCDQFSARASKAESSLVMGSPGRKIVEYADSTHRDLIVMGAVGRSVVERVVLGSVSDYAATHAKCSALVVRPGDAGVEAPKTILLALANSDQDTNLIRFMQKFEWSDDVLIHLLHVIGRPREQGEHLQERVKDFWSNTEKRIEEHGRSLMNPLAKRLPNTRIHVLSAPHIGEAVLDYASTQCCDLIVTGDQHRGFLNRALLGSTSRHILRHAACNVAITRCS